MKDYVEGIEALKALNLETCSEEEIHNAIHRFGRFGVIRMDLHPGKVILRMRPNNAGETYTEKSQLSYVPAHVNNSYQRASTPNQTMFYGTVIPENLLGEDINNARLTAFVEGAPLLRNDVRNGEGKVTFSKWVVKEDIPLIAIVYHEDFVGVSPHTKELNDAWHLNTKDWPTEEVEKSIAITQFLAGEFAKRKINTSSDYRISACFTQIAIKNGAAGVYYPSVRADAKGFCVAIHPDYADKLQLVVAGECTAYRLNGNTIVDNDTICEISDDRKQFSYTPVENEYHMGREAALAELGKMSPA